MATFKIVIADGKNGKCYQKELKDNSADFLLGKRIGDKIKGEGIDLTGYEFEITGGSDNCGIPMRKDVDGTGRKKILAVEGIGIAIKSTLSKKKVRHKFKGARQRKTVCGNTIHENTSQINLKILKYGKEPLAAEPAKEGEKKKEEKPKKEEKKAE